MTARWLDLSPGEYHALRDDCLTQSLAVELLQRSPAHARRKQQARAEPKTPTSEDGAEKRRKMEWGTLCHGILLGGKDDRLVVAMGSEPCKFCKGKGSVKSAAVGQAEPVLCAAPGCVSGTVEAPFADWKKKAAQEIRRETYAAGKIPVLMKDAQRAQAFCGRVREELGLLDQPIVLGEDDAHFNERPIQWLDDGVKCRGSLDVVHIDASAIVYDLKTGEDANPLRWPRKVEAMGYDVQAAAYVRAVEAMYPRLAGRVSFAWIVVEGATAASCEVVVIEASAAMLHLGGLKWSRALRTWRRCLEEQHWPGYGGGKMLSVSPAEYSIAAEMQAQHRATERDFAAMAEPRRPEGAPEPQEDEEDGEDEFDF